MSNGCFGYACYLLLILIDFLLKIIYNFSQSVLCLLGLLLKYIFDVTMTETSKKRKRDSTNNQTVAIRGTINANWQKFLSSNLIMDKKTEKPVDNDKTHYTGTFRRARKKKAKQNDSTVESNLKSLHLNNIANNTVQNNVSASKNNNVDGKTIVLDDKTSQENGNLETKNKQNKLTKFLAIDCEMVGIGYDGNDHMLARVSIVNKFGDCIYDKFVKAREEVKDYRTNVSGVRKEDLLNGEDFTTVQKEVAEIIKGKILVGHSLKNDLGVLFLSHPKKNIRDTSRYKPFRKVSFSQRFF